MEFDPLGGTRRHRNPGFDLLESVHVPDEQTDHHQVGPQHRPYITPPIYAPHDKQDISPSTKDGPKPINALDVDEDADSGGRRINRKCTRKRVVVPIAMLVTIIAIGAVLGGVLGTMLSGKQASSDKSPYFSPESGDAVVGSGSHLATGIIKGVHVIIAQTKDGELMTVEFHGRSKTDNYLIKDHTYNYDPPKALTNTPIEVVEFGSESHLHLFYFDDAFRLAHLVRTSKDGDDVWGPGALMEGRLPYEPADTSRLSACIMTSEWSESSDSVLMVMYQADNGPDYMVLLSSPNPDEAEDWNSQPFYLESEKLDAPLNKESSGLLILPTTRETNGKIEPALRILWDTSDEEKKTTFGSIECIFSDESDMTDCVRIEKNWRSVGVESRILEAPKPLSLSGITIASDVNGTSTWLIHVIDSDGKLTELYGTNEEWTDSNKVKIDPGSLPDGKAPTFTSARSINDGLLYAVADGKLMEFAKAEEEDADDAGDRWELLSVIKTE